GVRLYELHHRVLHRVERVVVVAQTELRDLEGTLLDTGEELLESAARHQIVIPTPLGPQKLEVHRRVINAAERNKRGHVRCNALHGDALTRPADVWRFCESGTYEHSRRLYVTSAT